MKKFVLAAAMMLAATAAFAADPAEGIWKTAPDDNGNFGHVQVKACGANVCGNLVKAFDGSGKEIASKNIGRAIVWDMANKGDGAYGGGKIYSPDRDKTYSGKMQLSGNKMTVKGCVIGICRDGGTWIRVK